MVKRKLIIEYTLNATKRSEAKTYQLFGLVFSFINMYGHIKLEAVTYMVKCAPYLCSHLSSGGVCLHSSILIKVRPR